MYSKFLKKNKALLKESRSFRNSRSLARRKRKVFEASYDDNIKKAWQDFKDSYDYPNLADAVLNELGDNLRDQLNELHGIYYGNSFETRSRDMYKFFIENEDDILAIVDDTGTKDTYQDIIETLIRNGLYSMCALLCDLAVGNVMHAFFDDIYLDDLDDDFDDEEYDDEDED